MSIFIKVGLLILLTYLWAKGFTLEYEDRIRLLEEELKRQKAKYRNDTAKLKRSIKYLEASK
jgi:hypothetical protein